MDNKFYVSYEVAKLLKEKGYDRECISYYYDDGKEIDYSFCGERNSTWEERCVSAPTKAEAIDWLDSKGFYVDLLYTLDGKWNCVITIPSYGMVLDDMELFDTRLEAEEAAIIKACELYERSK